MGISDAVLARLAKSDECVLIDTLDTDLPEHERGEIVKTLIRLKARQLADREYTGCYIITPSGRNFVESGQTINSGPLGKHTGPRKRHEGTMTIRLWKALRAMRKGTTPQLVSLARNDQDGNPDAAAARLLRTWRRSGFVTKIGGRAKGTAPTSNGHVIWYIVRDNGPKPPLWNPRLGIVKDANTGEIFTADGVLIENEVNS